MAWSFPELVAYASRGTWVRPGDVLGSGTCGDGCLLELWGRRGRKSLPLGPGDVVSLDVEGIGVLTNTVVAGAEPHVLPAARSGRRYQLGAGMSAVRPPKQRRSRESYERVLDAAYGLLEENGFEGFTVQEVAARANVSIGAIYERFGNKETLLRTVHARLMDTMAQFDGGRHCRADQRR